MFYEQRFRNHGSSTARSEQAGDRYDQVDEKYSEITYHGLIVTKASQMTRLGNLSDLCQE
jgi:flagellar biosynthesis GTPase FlhF